MKPLDFQEEPYGEPFEWGDAPGPATAFWRGLVVGVVAEAIVVAVLLWVFL